MPAIFGEHDLTGNPAVWCRSRVRHGKAVVRDDVARKAEAAECVILRGRCQWSSDGGVVQLAGSLVPLHPKQNADESVRTAVGVGLLEDAKARLALAHSAVTPQHHPKIVVIRTGRPLFADKQRAQPQRIRPCHCGCH